VDVAFLILSFFMLATKFKPPEPVEVTTPNSVSADKLKETDAIWVTFDKDNRVFFSVTTKSDKDLYGAVANAINDDRKLGLTAAEVQSLTSTFQQGYPIGVPFSQLKQILAYPPKEQVAIRQKGIPVLDSATNELVWWISAAKTGFAGKKAMFLIKGDGVANYPTFGGIIEAMKRNDELKYNLITTPEEAPEGTELGTERKGAAPAKTP